MKCMLRVILAIAIVLFNCGCFANDDVEKLIYISTEDEFYKISENLSGNYVLKNDIVFSGEIMYTPIGSLDEPFSGVLDGNGYCIRNLNMKTECINAISETKYLGLFGCVSGATIKNLGISGGSIKISPCDGNIFVGVFAGFSMTKSDNGEAVLTDIHNCYSAITIEGAVENNSYDRNLLIGIGGFLGTGCATFKNCYSKSKILTYQLGATQILGGFVGQPRTFEGYAMKIDCCYAVGAIVGGKVQGGYAGAFVGHSYTEQSIDIISSYYLSPHKKFVGFRNAVSGSDDKKYNGAVGVSYENFEKKESFSCFDFENSWEISKEVNGGHPYLKTQKT